MTQIQSMIEELAAAKVAMEENPQLKAQVVNLEYVRTDLEDKLEMLSGDHGILHESHVALETKLAQLEAELEAARFRELASREKLEKLVSSFRETIDEVASVHFELAGEESGTVVEESAAVLDEPMYNDATVEGTESATDGKTVWNDETRHTPMEVIEEASQMLHQPVDEIERTAKAEDFTSTSESAPGPTIGDGSGSETSGSSPQPWSKPRVTEVILPQPYAGLHHTRKPDAMSWPTWVDGGGMRPWWCTEDELNKLRLGSALAS